ncbi:hypothetical protein NMY22_g11535 [Coprinellus aureogranulatus]|nr:hypothetical protein NMY22_g11535 [Coprinellus aureogranulatus]
MFEPPKMFCGVFSRFWRASRNVSVSGHFAFLTTPSSSIPPSKGDNLARPGHLLMQASDWRVPAPKLRLPQWTSQTVCTANPSSNTDNQSASQSVSEVRPWEVETTTPTVPLSPTSQTRVGAHTWGFNVLDNLYLRNGTFYVLTSDKESVPSKVEIIHRLGRISTHGDEDDEGSNLVQYITPAQSRDVLGNFATVMPGVSFFVLDPPRFLSHFYHYWGEVLLGGWRVYSTLALSDPSMLGKLPYPSRFVFPFVDNDEWRDRAGLNGPIMHLAFPDAHIAKSDIWQDWVKTGGTLVFERSVTMNRVSAHKSPLGSTWFKMLGATQNLTVPHGFWEPIRKAITQRLWGYTPEVANSGRPSTGRRLLSPDHESLVAALKQLEAEGACTVRIPVMEKLTLREQLAEIASSTILLGVHGNGLTHQIFMPPSLRSAVIEIQPPGDYAFDYWMLARNMGHKHYMVRNDTVTTYGPDEWHKGIHFGEFFHSSKIPVHSPTVANLIRHRLGQPEQDVES